MDLLAIANAVAADAPSHAVRHIPDPVPGRVLHMDGDILCYWAGGNEDTTVARSRSIVLNKVDRMREQSGSIDVVVHLTGDASTKADRRIIAETAGYQAQRKGRKPHNHGYLRDWLQGSEALPFRVKVWTQREADDGVAVCAVNSLEKTGQPIAIGGRDKDFRMIPGVHIDWEDYELVDVPLNAFDVKDSKGTQFGHRWFWEQMLQGDGADNIPGLPLFCGKPVGATTAQRMLDGITNNRDALLVTLGAYEEHYGDLKYLRFAEQALLLWMRTDNAASVWDFVNRVCPAHQPLRDAVAYFEGKINAAYAEAYSLGATVAPKDEAG